MEVPLLLFPSSGVGIRAPPKLLHPLCQEAEDSAPET